MKKCEDCGGTGLTFGLNIPGLLVNCPACSESSQVTNTPSKVDNFDCLSGKLQSNLPDRESSPPVKQEASKRKRGRPKKIVTNY